MVLITSCCYQPTAQAQIKNRKIFDVIPASQRAQFIARLSLYIEYSLKDHQAELETLYNKETLCGICKGETKCIDECMPPMTVEVPEGYAATLIALKPRKVTSYSMAHYWDYSIDADQQERVSWKGKPPHIVKSKVRLFAVYENGDWYFSLVSIPGIVWL